MGLCTDKPLIDDFQDFDHYVTVHDNYGADVAPFLHQLDMIKEPLFIKLHSKKSLWGFKKHICWRGLLLNDLISSASIFKNNIKVLAPKSCGALCNPLLLLDNQEMNNSDKIQQLCSLIKIDYNLVKNSKFMAGNMFMGKTKLYQKYFSSRLSDLDKLLCKEGGKVSDIEEGTYSHSLERLFAYVVKYEGLDFCYPKHKVIKILNREAPNNKYFHLIKIYNNYCYLLEDPNVYGYFDSSKNTITWSHLDTKTEQKYRYIDSLTIQKVK